MTDAPETPTDAMNTDAMNTKATDTDAMDTEAMDTDATDADIEPLIAAWRTQLEGQVSVSASEVQDRLLDLWGALPDGEVRTQVERWLTETLERHLYQVADIDARLASVLPGE